MEDLHDYLLAVASEYKAEQEVFGMQVPAIYGLTIQQIHTLIENWAALNYQEKVLANATGEPIAASTQVIEAMPEINLSNYGDLEVEMLQEWAFKAHEALAAHTAPVEIINSYTEFPDNSFDKAAIAAPSSKSSSFAKLYRDNAEGIAEQARLMKKEAKAEVLIP